jgi:hypothetical protein
MRLVRFREQLGLELGGVQELNEMAVTKKKKVSSLIRRGPL